MVGTLGDRSRSHCAGEIVCNSICWGVGGGGFFVALTLFLGKVVVTRVNCRRFTSRLGVDRFE